MCAVGDRGLSTAQEKGQLKPRIFVNDIPQSGFKLGGGDVLGVEPSQGLSANEFLRVASGLRGPEFAGIAKDGPEVA